MQPQPTAAYTVSPQLLAREDFHAACQARDFAEIFRLMRRWDGASQNRVASPVEGLTQSRVSKIMRGADHIASQTVIERIADGLRIPGGLLGLAPRDWESAAPEAEEPPSGGLQFIRDEPPTVSQASTPAGELVDRHLSVDIDIALDGAATLTYRQDLFNGGSVPFTRLTRELWFEHTTGPLDIQAIPAIPADEDDQDARNVLVQRLHQTAINAHYACQVFPALQPGETARIAYACTGGRFVDAYYWRQAVVYPTDRLSIRVTQHGISRLTGCSAVEERADGSELSAGDSITWARSGDAVTIELTRTNLAVNQALTLRWDFPRA